jgi:predicted O-methyltransferase YrrM
VTTAEKYDLYGPDTYLAVSDEVGALLYLLVRARRPERVVEFGASRGISTLHLAAALEDAGAGSLVTTELEPAKAEATRANLARAGLGGRVEVLAGDARTTLAGRSGPVDVLFLDGRNDLYVEVLRLLEPALAPGALVLADLSPGDPDLEPYLALVRDPGGPFTSLSLAGGRLEASIGSISSYR